MSTVTLRQPVSLHREAGGFWPFRAAMWCILLGGLAATVFAYRYYGTFIRGADAQMYYAQVRSLVVDGDLAFTNEITQLSPHREVFFDEGGALRVARTADGRVVNKYAFGWAAVTLAPFAATHVVQSATGGPADGYAPAYDLTTALWHLMLVVGSLVLLAKTAARLTDPGAAALAAVGAFFATNVLYYTSVYPTMSHAASFAAVAVIVSLAIRLHDEPANRRLWLVAGAVAMFVALLRPTDVVLLVALLPAAWRGWRGRRQHGRAALVGPACVVGGVALAVVVQLVVWRISYGQWVVSSYGDNGEGFNWFRPAMWQVLVSFNHGAWYYHPMLLFGAVGLVVALCSARGGRRGLWAGLVAAFVLHVYVHAAWHDWSFSHSFGHRMFVNSAPLMLLGAAVLIHRLKQRRRYVATAVVGLLIAWNVLLMVTFIRGGIEPVGEVLPAKLIHAQVDTCRALLGRVLP